MLLLLIVMSVAQLSPDEQKDMLRHLEAAKGYLGLGMPMDAWNELEEIDARHRDKIDVLRVRMDVCRAMEKWEMMEVIALHLQKAEQRELDYC